MVTGNREQGRLLILLVALLGFVPLIGQVQPAKSGQAPSRGPFVYAMVSRSTSPWTLVIHR